LEPRPISEAFAKNPLAPYVALFFIAIDDYRHIARLEDLVRSHESPGCYCEDGALSGLAKNLMEALQLYRVLMVDPERHWLMRYYSRSRAWRLYRLFRRVERRRQRFA
jgi:hypothetical protein